MTQIIIYALASFGLAFIIGFSTISLPIREALAPKSTSSFISQCREWFLKLIECPGCIGTHTGFWFGFFFGVPTLLPFGIEAAIALALFTCGSNYLLARAAGLVGDSYE